MAFNLFKKSGGGKETEAAPGPSQRDPRKAAKFFEHAQAVADHDYAIECYVNGLRHDPGNMHMHDALHEIALRRKVNGGKPAGLSERLTAPKDPVDRMLHAEKLWAKDPLNINAMLEVMTRALDADAVESELNLAELAYWIGDKVLDANQNSKKPKESLYLKVCDQFERIPAYAKAVEACRLAIQLDEENESLLQRLRDLQAEQTMQEGGYQQSGADGFKASVKNIDEQRALDEEGRIATTDDAVDREIERRRTAYEEDPDDIDRLRKLVDALRRRETDEAENEAVELLGTAHEKTGEYRYKMDIGNVRMKQANRRLRQLKRQLQEDPDNEELKGRYQELYRQAAEFELKEFQERVENYPTDMRLRFELGKRLFLFKQFDEAIAAFQEAQADPKHRAAAYRYLGLCYREKGWNDEAIDAFNTGIENHPMTDDNLAKELRYNLMEALANSARDQKDLTRAERARTVASQILQTDINYRDIRQRIDEIRKLVEELRKTPA